MVSQHKETAVPVVMLNVYLLDFRYCLPEEAFIRKSETDSFVNDKIIGIVIEFIIAERTVEIESVPVRAVVAVHTECVIALVFQHLLCGGIISVPVVYSHCTAGCGHQ